MSDFERAYLNAFGTGRMREYERKRVACFDLVK